MSNFIADHYFQNKSQQDGFTLVELLVVISIIGILAAMLLTNFVGVRGRAGDAKKKNDLRQLKTALRLYYNDFQHYPTASGASIAGCGLDGDTTCGGEFAAGGNSVYMNQLPVDFQYFSDGGDSFILQAELENVSDDSILESQNRCNPAGRSYYSGTPTNLDFVMCED